MERDTAKEIREAIASQDYSTALRLWNHHAGQLKDEISRGAVTQETMAETRKLFEWSRNVVLCARAQNLDHLNAIHVANAYARMRSDL